MDEHSREGLGAMGVLVLLVVRGLPLWILIPTGFVLWLLVFGVLASNSAPSSGGRT